MNVPDALLEFLSDEIVAKNKQITELKAELDRRLTRIADLNDKNTLLQDKANALIRKNVLLEEELEMTKEKLSLTGSALEDELDKQTFDTFDHAKEAFSFDSIKAALGYPTTTKDAVEEKFEADLDAAINDHEGEGV